MADNKMADVAALFGKKLGEEFWVQGFCGVYRVKFTEGGILYLDTDEPNNYPMRRKTPSFSSRDISRALRIYVSN